MPQLPITPPVPVSDRFETYREFNPAIPVRCITPEGLDRCIHRFYDTSPISPSGRYVALTRLPTEDRPPHEGEPAEIVLVDLLAAKWSVVASTFGYDTQLGAHAQWGSTDHELYFNNMDVPHWRPFAVRLDPLSGERTDLDGTVYMVSPDGTKLASPCLLRTGLTQAGYGVVVPHVALPLNSHADEHDGIFITDASTGKCKLLVSFAQIFEALPEMRRPLEGASGALYGFHVKWNPQGTRLMFVIRWRRAEGCGRREGRLTRNHVVTMNADGSDIRLAMPAEIWARGGHHPNWCPDGEHIIQNLNLFGTGLQFASFRFDGTDLRALHPGIRGGGHPTLHPDNRHILTDAYTREYAEYGDGTTPLRWIDIESGEETTLVRIRTEPLYEGPMDCLRVDPHPAWDRLHRRIVFNACPGGKRRVFLADLASLL